MSIHTEPLSGTVLSFLQQLAAKHAPITLTKLFKGILLEQEVHILSVAQNYATFQACDIRAFVDSYSYIYLHGRDLSTSIQARILGHDLSHCTFTLTDFTFFSNTWQDRHDDRVQPQNPTYGSIKWGRNYFTASLSDLQARSIGLLANRGVCEHLKIKPGSEVWLNFHITPRFTWTALKGVIEYLRPMDRAITRLGIQIFPVQNQLALLQKYIAARRSEILDELETVYNQALGPRRVEELYF